MNERIDINRFLKGLNLRSVVLLDDYNGFYEKYFLITKEIYLKILNSSFNKSFSDDFAQQFYKLRHDILEVYRYYVKGDILRASTKMNNILFRRKYYGKYFYEFFLSRSNDNILYRCRQGNKNEVKTISKNIHDQMFHIAFNKRNLIGNCRFSISGFPCLYLGSSIKCCVNEIEWSKNNELVVCQYHPKENFLYYDLTLNNNIRTLRDLKIYLLKYLIVLAVSFTINPIIKNRQEKINSESRIKNFVTYYVIPQLITAAIASKGEKVKENQCIRYHSVKFINDYNQYNYVFIPRIKNYRINKYYDEDLYKKFEISLFKENVKENELVLI